MKLPWALIALMTTGSMAADLPTPAVLPLRIYGLVGRPLEIRFADLVYAPVEGSLLFDVETGPGVQGNTSLLWTPEATTKPHPLTIGVFSGQDFRPLANLRTELWTADPGSVKPSGTLRWLAIGDSLTAGGNYIRATIGVLKENFPEIDLETLGTQPPDPASGALRHEGRGGWTWQRFLEPDTSRTYHSPFIFGAPEAESFDFRAYLQEQKSEPSIITIFLGVNDVFSIAKDFSPEKMTAILQRAKTMVAKIREAAPQSVIGLILPPPPSEQNGFGKNYGTGVTAWQYRRARQYYLARILQEFDGRWGELIYVVPANLAFDPETSYPLSEGKAQNALHPKAKGYEVIGDSLAAWIVHLLTEKVISPGT